MSRLSEFFVSLGEQLWNNFKVGGRDIGAGIEEAIDFGPVFSVTTPFGTIPVPSAVLGILFTVVCIFLFSVWYKRRLEVYKISTTQSLIEKLFTMIESACKQNHLNDEQCEVMVPYIAGVGAFIILSNLVSVFKVAPPAQNPAFSIALAFFTLFFVIFTGIRFVGLKGFLRSLLFPKAILLPFNILDYIIKPVSLAFRLFGNIFGAYILIEFISLIVPLFVPSVLGIWFDIGDGIIQGLVFAYLTLTYVGEIVERLHELDIAEEEKQREEQRRREI